MLACRKWPVSKEMPAYRAVAAAGEGRKPELVGQQADDLRDAAGLRHDQVERAEARVVVVMVDVDDVAVPAVQTRAPAAAGCPCRPRRAWRRSAGGPLTTAARRRRERRAAAGARRRSTCSAASAPSWRSRSMRPTAEPRASRSGFSCTATAAGARCAGGRRRRAARWRRVKRSPSRRPDSVVSSEPSRAASAPSSAMPASGAFGIRRRHWVLLQVLVHVGSRCAWPCRWCRRR